MPASGELPFDKVPNSAGARYTLIEGHQAFVSGIHPNDVDQGLLGDCFFLSSIASIAQQRPSIIKNLIETLPNESYNVKLFKRGWFGRLTPMTINVTPSVPQRDGKILFTKVGDVIKSRFGRQVEVWPIILEKAYADMMGGYNKVIGGWPHHAMESLTGQKSQKIRPSAINLPQLQKMFDDGYAMACYTRTELKWAVTPKFVINFPDRTGHPRFAKNKQGGELAVMHAYFISGVDAANGIVKIRNPWGWEHGESELAAEDFEAVMRGVSVNPVIVA
ncbi:MAG: C2 family cysteine protease [Chloroflexota bacterium]